MLAHEFMITDVCKVAENDTIRSVIEKMIQHRINGLPVVNHKNEVVGFVTDGDIMRYIGKHKDQMLNSVFFIYSIQGDNENFEERLQHILKLPVMELARPKVHTVSWDEEMENIAAILGEKHYKKLPVVRNGVLVGIISRGDVIRHAFKNIL